MNADQFNALARPQRRDGIAYLERDGAHLRCFSRYGRTTRECAPVAWRLAYLIHDANGEPITSELLDSTMTAVVNEHESVAETIRTFGRYRYR